MYLISVRQNQSGKEIVGFVNDKCGITYLL